MSLLYKFIASLLAFLSLLTQVPVEPAPTTPIPPEPPEYIEHHGSSSYETSRFYEALTAIEKQDIRTNMVNIARSQIGYMEGKSNKQLDGTVLSSGNYTEYGYWYNMQDAWCAMFVSWCAELAGDTNIPKHASCTTGLKALQKMGVAHSRASIANGEYVPQPGDVIYFANKAILKPGRTSSHVGIVTKYENGRIYTIEGNTSPNDKSINTGGIVAEKSYSISSTYIVYVCELIT
jgi:hypothetical protein